MRKPQVRLYPIPKTRREYSLGYRWRLVGRIRDYFYKSKRDANRDLRFWREQGNSGGSPRQQEVFADASVAYWDKVADVADGME